MPIPSAMLAEQVSRALYRITRPHNADASETTQYLFGWATGSDGTVYLLWDDSIVVPVNALRGTRTVATLSAFVAAGRVTAASANAVASLVQSRAGGTVTLGEITPPEWRAQMRPDSDRATLFPPSLMP